MQNIMLISEKKMKSAKLVKFKSRYTIFDDYLYIAIIKFSYLHDHFEEYIKKTSVLKMEH